MPVEMPVNVDIDVLHRAVRDILVALDLDPGELGLRDTPDRVARYLLEFRRPLDVPFVLGPKFSSDGHHGMICQAGIPFRMICEHHLVPAWGRASIGYVPDKYIVGLSKLTRLVQAIGTERPSLQEYINDRITDALNEYIEPKGVIVTIAAEHGCMACRGINTPGVKTVTSSVRGIFLVVPAAREEFFSLTRNREGS